MGELDTVGFLRKTAGRIASLADAGGVGEDRLTIIGDDRDIARYLMLFVIRQLVVLGMNGDNGQVRQLSQSAVVTGSRIAPELQLRHDGRFRLRTYIPDVTEPSRAVHPDIVHLSAKGRTRDNIDRHSVHKIRPVGTLENT